MVLRTVQHLQLLAEIPSLVGFHFISLWKALNYASGVPISQVNKSAVDMWFTTDFYLIRIPLNATIKKDCKESQQQDTDFKNPVRDKIC